MFLCRCGNGIEYPLLWSTLVRGVSVIAISTCADESNRIERSTCWELAVRLRPIHALTTYYRGHIVGPKAPSRARGRQISAMYSDLKVSRLGDTVTVHSS